MTKFEKRIHAHVVERIPKWIEDLKKLKYLDQSPKIQYPFTFESVIDSVVFDGATFQPLYIEYKMGVGPCVSDGLTTSFDEYEMRRLAVVMPKPRRAHIDKEQIESASWEFVADKVNQPNGWIRTAFVAGAQWAIEQSKQTK